MAAGDLTPIQGLVDPAVVKPYGANQQWRFSPARHGFVDQVLPTKAELVRMGKVFTVSGGVIANAVAAVVDMPTTATINGLYNGNTQASDICLVMLKVSSYSASGTLGVGQAMIAGIGSSPQSSAPAVGTGAVGPSNCLPTSSNKSNAVMTLAVALGGAAAWNVLGGSDNPAAAEIGAGAVSDLEGLYIVPPGYMFGAHVIGGTTAGKFLFSFVFAEYKLQPQSRFA